MLNHTFRCLLLAMLVHACGANARGEDWTAFRGPTGQGISTEKNLPLTWSATENIAWKVELPGPGSSSPITLGDRLFITCYSGYGVEPNEGEQENLRRPFGSVGGFSNLGRLAKRCETETTYNEKELFAIRRTLSRLLRGFAIIRGNCS